MTTNIIDLGKKLQEGNKYPLRVKCPNCGEEYFALFDKAYIDLMGFCYWPCGNDEPKNEMAATNVLALIDAM